MLDNSYIMPYITSEASFAQVGQMIAVIELVSFLTADVETLNDARKATIN